MAQDTRKALDEKTRKLTGRKIEEGKEHSAYQETQQQLLAIQAEQQQNLAVARAESKASFDNNQTLAQAAELGVISAAEAEQTAAMGAQAGAQLNPATQQILSKYGAGQPRFSRTHSYSQQVTKQNITINNNITSNTTNDVKVPANVGGPIQGRPLQFKDPSTSAGEGSIGKFKTWISAAFARQNEEGAKRDREYRNRENSLTKSASKMMKKLEDIGKTIGSRMDPRKIGSTWQSQLKTLLLLFGFGYLTSNWTKVLEKVSDIEQWVRNTWNYFSEGKFISDFKEFIGGNGNEHHLTSLYELFLGNDGFLGRFKDYLKEIRDDRKSAMSMVKFPEINFNDMIGTIKGVGEYIGNLLAAIVSGTEGTQSIITNQIETAANKGAFEQAAKDKSTRDTISRSVLNESRTIQADKGVEALTTGDYRGLTRYSIDDNGNLTNQAFGAEATIAQTSDISRIFDLANHGKGIRSTELAAGLQRLYNSAKLETQNGKGIPVTPSFLKNWFKDDELKNLQRSKDIRRVDYYAVARKKTEADFAIESADPLTRAIKAGTNQAIFNEIPVLGDAAKKIKMAEGAGVGAGVGTLFGIPFVGAAVGGAVGWAASTPEYQAISEYLKGTIDRTLSNDYRVEYVREPRPGDKILTRPGTNEPARIPLWEITDKAVQKITDKITGKENTNIDINDESFVTSVQSGLQESARNVADNMDDLIKNAEQQRKENPQDFENNRKLASLRQYQSELKHQNVIDYDINQAYQQRDQFNKEREEREAAYKAKHVNDRVAKTFENMGNYMYNMSDGRWGTHIETLTAGKSVDSSELKRRKQYLFKLLRNEGLSDGAIAGIIGNLESEGLNKKDTGERKPDPPGSGRYSIGIAQFNSGGELPKLQEWARKNGLNYNTFETQAQYIANHPVIDKILIETNGLNSQDSLKKSAIIWGHDFERFKGHNAADSHGNLIGRGAYISVQANSKDKYREDGKFHGDENYAERIQKGLNTYNTYSGSDLSEITLWSSKSFKQENNEETTGEKSKPKSFLEILKETVTDFIMNLGGAADNAVSPIVDGIKEKIFTDGYTYTGPITKEFTDYETYLKNQNKLPEELPAGLSYADWKNRVFDVTGSMPQNLDLSPVEVNRQKEELRKDSKEILEKYTKPGETNELAFTAPEITNKEKEAISETKEPIIEIPEPESANPFSAMFDPKNFEKKEDRLDTIVGLVTEANTMLGKILGVESANGITSAHIVDAVNQGTMASANASINMARSLAVQQSNRTENMPSLQESRNKSLTGVT